MFELKGKYNSAIIYTDLCDQETISQIMDLLNLDSMKDCKIRIMPDTHAGSGCVIGTTMTIKDKIIANLVGVDIGCGMLSTRLREKEIDFAKLDDVIRRFVPSGFDVHERAIASSNAKDIIAPIDFEKSQKSLGSLGGGNHFIEVDKDDQGNNWLVIHTGSRHLGKEVCKHYQDLAYRKLKTRDNEAQIKETIAKLKSQGKYGEIENAIKIIKMQGANVSKDLAHLEGEDFANYVHDMKIAQEHAKINRATIAGVILDAMGLHKEEQFDTIHNYLDTENMILRKGAISAREGERVLIPMNMRDGSLICTGKGKPEWNFSAPHGAGRLMSRAKAKEAVDVEEFRDSMAGIWSTSVGLSTLDESPFAYKPMESILENIRDTVNVDCIIKPLYNFKAGEKERLTELTRKNSLEENKEDENER